MKSPSKIIVATHLIEKSSDRERELAACLVEATCDQNRLLLCCTTLLVEIVFVTAFLLKLLSKNIYFVICLLTSFPCFRFGLTTMAFMQCQLG